MKLDVATLGTEVEDIGKPSLTFEGGMSSDDLAKFIDLITVQAYSNPEGSIVRELTSNCFDAHIKWQKWIRLLYGDETLEYNEPVIIKYSEEEGQGFISFIDVGTGLSPSDMKNIYIHIGKSDKMDSNDYTGCYGAGSKSFLSYTPSIDLITTVDGIEYNYLVYKNGRGLLEASCVLEKNTDERNGTEVKLCIGKREFINLGYVTSKETSGCGYRTKDFPRFREEILKQLYYFDNVYTVGFDLENDYRIYEAFKDDKCLFKIRNGHNPFKEMHIILGKVAYPIDWEAIGMEKIMIPVGVKFDIGELYITLSRENIRYNSEEKNQLIRDRINEVLEDTKFRYNKNNVEVDTLEEYLKHLESPNKLLVIQDVTITLPKVQKLNKAKTSYENVDVIEGLKDVKWKPLAHLPIEVPKDPYFIFHIKGVLMKPDGKGNSKLASRDEKNIFKGVQQYNGSVYRLKEDRTKTTDLFLWWKHQHGRPALFISKYKGWGFSDYKQLFDTKTVKRQTTNRELYSKKTIFSPISLIEKGKNVFYGKTFLIKEYKKAIIKDLVARSQAYEKVVPSAEYLSELQLAKLARKRPKLEGKITIYDLVNDNSSTGKEFELSKLSNYEGFIVYGEREKLEKLQGVKDMLTSYPIRKSKPKPKIIKPKIILTGRMVQGDVIDEDTLEIVLGEVPQTRTVTNSALTTSRVDGYGRLRKEACRIFITAKSNHKLLQGNSYFMHVEEFLSNNNRMFRNSVTAWYINRELNSIYRKHSNLTKFLEQINWALWEKRRDLSSWVSSNWNKYANVNESFMESCYGIAKENNFLWPDKIIELEAIQKWFEGDLQIFSLLGEKAFENKETFKDVIALLKMKHKRLSAEHYFVPTVEEEQLLEQAKEITTYKLSLEPMVKQLLIYNNKKQA